MLQGLWSCCWSLVEARSCAPTSVLRGETARSLSSLQTRGGPSAGLCSYWSKCPEGWGRGVRNEDQIQTTAPCGLFVGTCDMWECMICGNAAGVGRAAPHSPDGNPHGYFSLEATADIFKSKSTWVQAPGGPSQPPRAPGSGSVSEGACYKSIWSLKTT